MSDLMSEERAHLAAVLMEPLTCSCPSSSVPAKGSHSSSCASLLKEASNAPDTVPVASSGLFSCAEAGDQAKVAVLGIEGAGEGRAVMLRVER